MHVATKFVKLNAEKAPFFVEKLAVKVLPTIVLFKDGIALDRIVGFEEFGGSDDFKTEILAQRIAKKGIIILVRITTPHHHHTPYITTSPLFSPPTEIGESRNERR